MELLLGTTDPPSVGSASPIRLIRYDSMGGLDQQETLTPEYIISVTPPPSVPQLAESLHSTHRCGGKSVQQ